jgi:hypothetical protein
MFVRSNISGVRKTLAIAVALLPALQPIAPVLAGPNEQAERLFGRITGSEPSATVLAQMSSDITANNAPPRRSSPCRIRASTTSRCATSPRR